MVAISTPALGTLVNRVNTSDRIEPWRYGAGALMRDLARRAEARALLDRRGQLQKIRTQDGHQRDRHEKRHQQREDDDDRRLSRL